MGQRQVLFQHSGLHRESLLEEHDAIHQIENAGSDVRFGAEDGVRSCAPGARVHAIDH
jgi:hypothetical protein